MLRRFDKCRRNPYNNTGYDQVPLLMYVVAAARAAKSLIGFNTNARSGGAGPGRAPGGRTTEQLGQSTSNASILLASYDLKPSGNPNVKSPFLASYYHGFHQPHEEAQGRKCRR